MNAVFTLVNATFTWEKSRLALKTAAPTRPPLTFLFSTAAATSRRAVLSTLAGADEWTLTIHRLATRPLPMLPVVAILRRMAKKTTTGKPDAKPNAEIPQATVAAKRPVPTGRPSALLDTRIFYHVTGKIDVRSESN